MSRSLPKFTRLDKPARVDRYGLSDSVIGFILCGWQGNALVRIGVLPAGAENQIKGILEDAKIPSDATRDDARAKSLVREHLFPQNTWTGKFTPDLEIAFYGTDFQWNVMNKLLRVKSGTTVSYQELGQLAGHDKAARASGSVCARNPIPLIVPCHRILASNGGFGGYAFGTALKRQFLDWEKANA